MTLLEETRMNVHQCRATWNREYDARSDTEHGIQEAVKRSTTQAEAWHSLEYLHATVI